MVSETSTDFPPSQRAESIEAFSTCLDGAVTFAPDF